MANTTIYLVRHAEVWNSEHIWYGRLPGYNLCPRGEFQAEKLKEYFADKNISIIYTSPLERTVQTAKIISDGGIPIKKDARLLEANYTHWEGLPADDRPEKEVAEYKNHPLKVTYLGETLPEMEKRMVSAIKDAVKKHMSKKIIILSHADPIIIARLSFAGKSLDLLNKTKHLNAAIATLIFNDKLKCKGNDYKEIVPAKKDPV